LLPINKGTKTEVTVIKILKTIKNFIVNELIDQTIAHSRYVGSGRNDLQKTVVDDGSTVCQRRIEQNARSLNPQMDQQDLLGDEFQVIIFVTETVAILPRSQVALNR